MTVKSIYAVALSCLALIASGPALAQADLVSRFVLSESAFSPDGDGAEDSTVASYTLSEDSPLMSIVVYESDSATVVDTLLAPGAVTAGRGEATWHGTYFNGAPAPEGLYLVTLSAQGTSAPDTSVTLPVALDNTPPMIQILLSEPGIYAPGLSGTPQTYSITFVMSNASPTYGLPTLADELTVDITDPQGAVVVVDTLVSVEPKFAGENGIYEWRWEAAHLASPKDGVYQIDLTVSDKAGHSDAAIDNANFDVKAPDMGFINVEEGESFITLPDSLYAWAWDRNGLDSLYVRYGDTLSYHRISNWSIVDDTTYFAVPLADSLPGEGTFRLGFRVKDAVAADTGRVTVRALQVIVDRSAPAAPSLEPFSGVWRNPTFTLRGSWTGDPEMLRIFRNGVQVDSVFTIVIQELARPVALEPGVNVFTATAVDEAQNESPPSNTVTVTFDDQAGLFIPAPFGPNDSFDVNLGQYASEVTLRVFDLGGDPVIVLTQTRVSKNYAFAWDGLNGDGESVKKGPLVAVAEVWYEDGSKEVFREILLFDPNN